MTGADYNVVSRLNAYTWPADSMNFARERGLPIGYVDNCWSRVALSGADLREFLKLGAAGDQAATNLLKSLVNDDWYVINDEEF